MEISPIIISFFSLGISLLVAYRAWRYNELSTRRASRESHTKMLVDIGKILVDSPELWAIHDTHPLAINRDVSPMSAAKREAFIYQHFNIFEIVRDYYINIILRDHVDEEYWQSWHRYIRHFVSSSEDARRLFTEQYAQEVYSKGFVEYMNQTIKELPCKGA